MAKSKQLVLLVDDEESFRMSVEDGLARYSERFEVVTASNGVQALGVIESRRPCMVVTDMRMPAMDGIELLLSCRRLYPHLPVILVSAYFSEELERNARSFGAAAVLHKPLDLNVLVNAILAVLDRLENEDADSDGYLANFSLPGFLQLLSMERRTCTLAIRAPDGRLGTIWLEGGNPINAVVGALLGIDAALEIIQWQNADITMMVSKGKQERRITQGMNYILLESARLADERSIDKAVEEGDVDRASDYGWGEFEGIEGVSIEEITSPEMITKGKSITLRSDEFDVQAIVAQDQELSEDVDQLPPIESTVVREDPTQESRPPEIEENKKVELSESPAFEQSLSNLEDVAGFIAVGAFSPSGEVIAERCPPGYAIVELGALANDVLIRSHRATESIGVGRSEMLHIAAPDANIVVRVFDAEESPELADFYMVLVLKTKANVGLGKIQLDKAAKKLAPILK